MHLANVEREFLIETMTNSEPKLRFNSFLEADTTAEAEALVHSSKTFLKINCRAHGSRARGSARVAINSSP